ncbi:MAG: hypothetical protein IIC36_00765 [Gemmatimonadetes bacterium]|jgi:hypothetical protein|nr:hypothetical protein [Gemmatimonadota bacterium]
MSSAVKSPKYAVGRVVLGLLAAALVPVYAQAQSSDIPRTVSGRPDLNGIWQALGNAHWDIEPHQARAALQMVPGPVVPIPAPEVVSFGALGAVPPGMGIVEGGEIPYLPQALATREANRASWVTLDPVVKCYLPGVPRATYMPFPFQIFQSESAFFITYEYAGADRNIYLEDPGPPQVDAWMGQSVGHWEGDTFVVEAQGFTGQAWLDRSGNHASYQLRVTERYTMTSPYHILYEATLEDPGTFSRPWTIRLPLYKHIEDNARIGVFKCVEFVEELLYGQYRKVGP